MRDNNQKQQQKLISSEQTQQQGELSGLQVDVRYTQQHSMWEMERFIEYSRYCCDMKYFKLEIIYWFFELLSRFSVCVVRLIMASRIGVGVEEGSWNLFFVLNYGRYKLKDKQSLRIIIGSFYFGKWDWEYRR